MGRLLMICFCLLTAAVFGDNLRLGECRILSVAGDVAEVEVKLAWSNSWRNTYNYDAVYLFGKYRLEDTDRWYHVYFETGSGAEILDDEYESEVVNTGRGIFIYKRTESTGVSAVTFRLKWKFSGNPDFPLTASSVADRKVRLSFQGIEMVYVPTAPFYAGGGLSEHSFSSLFGILPAVYDIIGLNSSYVYSANGGEAAAVYAAKAADRYNQGLWNASNRHDWCGTVMPAWWRVDFKTAKKILYFGVSGIYSVDNKPMPASDWYLEGSNDATNWTVLWQGGPEYWGQSLISYPVQQAIRVTNPGSYRYYQVRVTDNQRSDFWNNIMIANVAMTEVDLGVLDEKGHMLMVGGQRGLPDYYPEGVNGFFAMKYELTQEQYVTFLNQQNREAQYSRTIGGILDKLEPGDYIFGDQTAATCRNGIVLQERRLNNNDPYVFACDLNRGNMPNSLDDGQTLACNYLSPADMLAYADWCGLRPLSEFEFEKMCREAYPLKPAVLDYAWGHTPPLAGTGWTAKGLQTEAATSGNVNAGGILGGPARVGSFVRTGNRGSVGNSFWGISDLNGNLDEIYVNAEIFGRQFDVRGTGSGKISETGEHTVGEIYWPVEADAYGIRGGNYATPVADLSVWGRDSAFTYFKSLTERKPTVGVRLGFSPQLKKQSSVLTLENGLLSGVTIVYDTVCCLGDYVILGEKDAKQYLWFESDNDGEDWYLLEGMNKADLGLHGLIERIKPDTVVKYLYKRVAYLDQAIQESGIVGLVVSHGIQINHLRDTLQPCMAFTGFTVSTQLPSSYRWVCMDNDKVLTSEENEDGTSSHCSLSISDISQGYASANGHYALEVKIQTGRHCEWSQRLGVVVLPYTRNPFPSPVETMVYTGDTHQVVNVWGGSDRQGWKILNEEKLTLMIDDLGVINGLKPAMCKHMMVEAVCKDYPDQTYRVEVHEPVRTFECIKEVWPVTLFPGDYRMECWGANGGVGSGGTNPVGYGGYTSGEISFNDMQDLFLYIGECGMSTITSTAFNGGGAAFSGSGHNGGRGGGASDIRLVGGAWNNAASLRSRIMVAGGGGGAMPNCGGGGATAGHGGGLTGFTSLNTNGSYVNNRSFGGSQTAGGTYQYGSNANHNGVGGSFGVGAYANTCAAGGGSGYYGGGSLYTSGGGGGSSFISGFPGCDAVTAAGTHTGQPVHYSGWIFANPQMLSGDLNMDREKGDNGRIVITIIDR